MNKLELINLIDKLAVEKTLTYEMYYQLIKELLQIGKTTGQNQDEKYVKHAGDRYYLPSCNM